MGGILGRSSLRLAALLTAGSSLAACGGRDGLLGGPYGSDGTGGNSAGTGGASSGHTGGVTTTGGASDAGGSNPAGGSTATGGSSTGSGGVSHGGTATGGTTPAAGGTTTGGTTTGGSATDGTTTGGSAGDSTSSGGTGGDSTAAGGSAAGGSATGGDAPGGSSTSGGTAAGDNSSGGTSMGGSSGSSGSGGTAQLGDPCVVNGAIGCHGAAQRLQLLCDGGVWKSNGTCLESQNCEQTSGVCRAIVPECAHKAPGQRYCKTYTLNECGPDLVTFDAVEECSGGCVETQVSAECAAPSCGDGRTEGGETCDDGDRDDTNACTNACENAVCGDGSLYAGNEKCDDHNLTGGDGCSVVCGADAVFVEAGDSFTCAIGTTGVAQCWGSNYDGNLGIGDNVVRGYGAYDMGVHLPAVNLGTGKSAVSIAAYGLTACALLNDGSVKCWGYNSEGGLGVGDTANRGTSPNHLGDNLPAVPLGAGRHAVDVAVGAYHACALLDDQTLKCWGGNDYGQLGLGDTWARGDVQGELGDALAPIDLGTGARVKAVAAGTYHTCAILDDGGVKCWGANNYGQSGWGDDKARGDETGEMGAALPSVELGTGRTAVAIGAGYSFTCALLDDATVKCWGSNDSGQLGQGDSITRGFSPGDLGDNLPAIALGTGRSAKALAVGMSTACVLLDDDQVKCWGYNPYGGLGTGDTNHRGDRPNEMGDFLPAVNLGTGRHATRVTVGSMHTCALLDNGGVKCWGSNIYAQLGNGGDFGAALGDGAGELGDNLPYTLVTF